MKALMLSEILETKSHVLREIATNSFMLSERFAKNTFLSQKLTNT